MVEAVQRIAQAGLTRDEARRERQEEKNAGPRPQPFIFNYRPENESFRLRIQFRKSNVSRDELIETLRGLLEALEHDQRNSSEGNAPNPPPSSARALNTAQRPTHTLITLFIC